MDINDKTDSSEEIVIRFGLKIDKLIKGKNTKNFNFSL